MKVVAYLKRLNKTELGESGTHDSYIRFPNDDKVIRAFFPEKSNQDIPFLDRSSQQIYDMRVTFGRECRVTQLPKYAVDKRLEAGDEIFIQKTIWTDGTVEYTIDCIRHRDIIVFEYLGADKGFVIWDQSRLHQLIPQYENSAQFLIENGTNQFPLVIKSSGEVKKKTQTFDSYTLDGIETILDLDSIRYEDKLIVKKKKNRATFSIEKMISWDITILETK